MHFTFKHEEYAQKISAETGIPRSQVWRTSHNDGIYPNTLKKCNNLYQEMTSTVYNFEDALKGNQSLKITFCSWMRFNFTISPILEVCTPDHMTIHIEAVQSTFQHRLLVIVWCKRVAIIFSVCIPLRSIWQLLLIDMFWRMNCSFIQKMSLFK
jgi:hypothetical protein